MSVSVAAGSFDTADTLVVNDDVSPITVTLQIEEFDLTGTPDMHDPDCEYRSSHGMIAVSVDDRLKDRDNVEVPLECVKDADDEAVTNRVYLTDESGGFIRVLVEEKSSKRRFC